MRKKSILAKENSEIRKQIMAVQKNNDDELISIIRKPRILIQKFRANANNSSQVSSISKSNYLCFFFTNQINNLVFFY